MGINHPLSFSAWLTIFVIKFLNRKRRREQGGLVGEGKGGKCVELSTQSLGQHWSLTTQKTQPESLRQWF